MAKCFFNNVKWPLNANLSSEFHMVEQQPNLFQTYGISYDGMDYVVVMLFPITMFDKLLYVYPKIELALPSVAGRHVRLAS